MSAQLQVTGEAKIRDIQGPVVANSGVITALDGAASQYVRGDGTLADFPSSSGGGSSVSYYLNSSVSQGTIDGNAYRELSKEPIIGTGTDIAISSNGYVANYITDANDPDVILLPGGNFNCEFYFSVNNNTGSPTTYAELYKYDGSTFTLLGSSSGVPESINQGTTIAPYYFAIPVATATLATTDRLAIRIYVNVDGRTVTLHTENSHLCQVVTTLSKGMVSLNNLTDQSQYLTTGTSGTNFAIVSSGDTHTFNLPVASATNTGKLSSTDWTTFNNKQNAITDPITGTGTSTGVAYFNSGTSITSEAAFNYDASTNRLGVNTSVPNATIGANAGTDGGYSLLLKNDNANYNGIGFATSSVYGNVIGTEKLGTAPAMNMTLLNQSGYISITETGNLGVNIINPNAGVDIYSSTSSSLWLHTANSGVSGTDGVRFSLFSNSNAVLRNNEGSLAMSSEGDFYVITLGAENIRVNSTDGKVGIGNPTTVSEMLTVNGSIQQAGVLSSMLKTNGDGKIIAAVAGTDYVAPSSLSGYVPTSRTLTINGTAYDLSADRSWSVGTITGSGADGRVPFFDSASGITYDSGFIYESGANRLGVNTVSPNATIGANAPTDGIYSLLLKNSDTNYSGIGFGTSSVYGNTIETVRIGTAPSRNLTLYNYAGYVSITESGNLGVNILTPNNGIDIYNSTQSQLWLHNNATGVSSTDGVRLALFNNKSANLVNFDGPLSLTAEGDFSVITLGAENIRVNSVNGYVGIGNPSTVLALLHVYHAENAADLLVQTNSITHYAEIAARNYNSVATTYYRQYSSSTTGTDFGLSRSNLAALFSNYASNFAVGTQNGGDLILGTANTERMRILASGNIGIGTASNISASLTIYTTSAANQLKLAGTAPASVFTESLTSPSYVGVVGLATSSNNFLTGSIAGDFVIANQKNFSILFGTGSTTTEKMRLTSDGKLLIGTTTDNGANLNVNGVIYGTRARLNNSYDNASVSLNIGGQTYMDSRTSRLYQTYNLSSMTNYMHIYDPYATSNANGGISIGASSSITTLPSTSIIHFDGVNNRVGIGTTAPSYTLDVNGTGRFVGAVRTTGSSSAFVMYRRDTDAYAGGWYSAAGDISLDMTAGVGTALNFTYGSGAATFSSSVTAGGSLIVPTESSYTSDYSIRRNSNAVVFTGGTSGYYFNSSGNARTDVYINGSGNVGIGTSSPQARTDSYYLSGATSNLGSNIVLGVGTDGGTVGTFTQIGLGYHNRNAGNYFPAIIASVVENSSGQNAEGIVFATRSATTGTTRPTERMRITSGGGVAIGATAAGGTYKLRVINSSAVQGDAIFASDNNVYNSILVYAAGADGYNGAGTIAIFGRNTSTGRSINAGGTINASGADYAEYMTKAIDDVIAKGDIVGVDVNGLLTNIFADAKSFVVKSTDPSYVGGDSWGNIDGIGKLPLEPTNEQKAEYEAKLEAARAKVDRIAFSGQIPCNVYNAKVGDYIIPIELNGKISGQAVSNPTFEQYQISVGKVWKIMEDGRAWIAVKIG